jgi:hypothetical protein
MRLPYLDCVCRWLLFLLSGVCCSIGNFGISDAHNGDTLAFYTISLLDENPRISAAPIA